MHTDIDALREKLRAAKRIVVLTGAGVSAESGIPTFRGEGGLWRNYRATDLATPEAFERNPALVWEFYNWRRLVISKVDCNPAHHALAAMEKGAADFALITQNIDGLHLKAGSRNVLEIHGNIWKVRCVGCGDVHLETEPDLGTAPACGKCGALLRPHVVWFGEGLDPRLLDSAYRLSASCDLMFVIGTSAVVQPAASFPFAAKDSGAFVVEINPERTPLAGAVDLALVGKAGEIVPQLVAA
ncbi:MAG: NAD-dependent deacylase [Desulforhabdus sp.]|jgi:NAD-dependent deacetylase|nr:NAD-dependent deacylase [Desulforhabdus sp.]